VDSFHGSAGDIYLDNNSMDLDITDVNANRLDVVTNGNITGEDITVHEIIINAGGFVGSEEDPFEFWADGYVSITGGLGSWWRNLYRPVEKDVAQIYAALLVMRFDVIIDGRDFTLYALVGVTHGGRLELIGFFLCKGEADQAFWTRVFEILKKRMGIALIDRVIHNGDKVLEGPAAEAYGKCLIIDLADRKEVETLEQAALEALKQCTERPEQLLEQLSKLSAEIAEQLDKDFGSEEDLRNALADFSAAYFAVK